MLTIEKPFFSVIIPNYNTEIFIRKCLDSLLKQTFKKFEIIIIDDCSTDSSLEIIKQYQIESELCIKVLINEQNMGPAKSRERAIRIAEGEYIAFCDSDDWYDDNYLELAYQKICKSHSDICICGFKTVSTKRGYVDHFLPDGVENMSKNQILTLNVDGMWAMIIRRRLIYDVPFPDMRNGEDMALIPIILKKANSFSAINKCPYNYYYREGSASMKANNNVVNSLVNSYEYIYSDLNCEYSDECEFLGIRNLLYGAILNLFKFCFDRKKANEIVEDFEYKYPNWKTNKYWKQLPFYKKIFLKFVSCRNYCGVWLLAKIHTYIVR